MNVQLDRASDDDHGRIRSKVTWPYIAGFIDCDGWITWSQPKQGRIRVSCGITQSVTRLDGMKVIQKYLEDQGVRSPLMIREKSWKSEIKMVNVLVSARTSVIKLLENVLPYIILKHSLAHQALEIARRVEEERLRKRPRRNEIQVTAAKSKMPWTEEDVALLKAYTAAGYNAAAIAAKLQRSCGAVSSQQSRRGLVKRNG